MSWIGGLNDSFSQLTSKAGQIGGQLSNFTKEVLSEGTDEVTDFEAEVKSLRLKLIEAESVISENELQFQKQKQNITSLQEQCRQSDLELHSRKREYESKIQKQNELINKLKSNLNVQNADVFDTSGRDHTSTESRRTFSGGSADAADYADVISYQQEINRLSQELERVQRDRDQWKNISQSDAVSSPQNDESLQAKVKELETRLSEERDRHQHEYVALQQANAVTVGRLQDENRMLRNRLSQDGGERSKDAQILHEETHSQKIDLAAEVEELKEKLRTRNRQLQVQKKSIEELRSELEEGRNKESALSEEITRRAGEIGRLNEQLTEMEKKAKENSDKLKQYIEDIAAELPSLDGEVFSDSPERIIYHVKELRESCDRRHEELNKVTEAASETEHEDVSASPKSDINRLDASSGSAVDISDVCDKDQRNDLEQKVRMVFPDHLMQPLFHSSPQVAKKSEAKDNILSPHHSESFINEGDLTLTLKALQKQVDDYEIEIQQYELVQKEWQEEKQSLQLMLDRYQNEIGNNITKPTREASNEGDRRAMAVAELQREIVELQEARLSMEKDKVKLLHEKEQLQTAVQNLEEELNMSITEAQNERDNFTALKSDLKKALDEKSKLEDKLRNVSEELDSSRMEKVDLDNAIEALDEQHQDEMTQILKIRDDLSNQLKMSDNQLQLLKEKNGSLMQENEKLLNEVNILMQKSNVESELTSVREDLAFLVTEKSSIEEQLASSNAKLSIVEKQLEEANEMMLNAEDDAKTSQAQLQVVTEEKMEIENQLKSLDEDNKKTVEVLQQKLKNFTLSAQDSESRIDALENQKMKVEKEQEKVLSKLEELKNENGKLISELNTSQEEHQKSVEDYVASIDAKEEQLNRLRLELDVANQKEKLRLEEMTQHNLEEASEVTLLKTELQQINENLVSSEKENGTLKLKIEEKERNRKSLETQLKEQKDEISDLTKQLETAKTNAVVQVRDAVDKYEEQLSSLADAHAVQLEELKENHQFELNGLREKCNADLEEMDAEQKSNLEVVMEERNSLQHQTNVLEERVKFMEQDVNNEVEEMQQQLKQSSEIHCQEMDELKSVNDRLTKELAREHTLVESLEEEVRKQIESQRSASEKTQQDFTQLHSAAMNEKSLLRSGFDEEKEKMIELHKEELLRTKAQFKEETEQLEQLHSQNILKVIEDLKVSHKEEIDALNDQLLKVEKEVERSEHELKKTQGDLSALSAHMEQEELKWRENTAEAMEELRMSHKEEILRLKSDNEELMEENVNRNVNSFGNELVNYQLADAQERNLKLQENITDLEKSNKEEKARFDSEVAKHLSEIQELKSQLVQLTESKKLNSTNTSTNTIASQDSDDEMKSHYEDTIRSLRSELEKLKLASKKHTATSSEMEDMLEVIRARDLSGLEKSDLSKEDIGSLLTLIKERDDVINVLNEKNNLLTAQTESKSSSSDLEARFVQLNEEKEQMLSVISEKTKENRQLKDEIHQMVEVISAGKSALSKVQEENQALIAKYEGFDEEMTKETVARLSKLISAKDLEIESLKQKCQTLLDVLQQQEKRETSSAVPSSESSVSLQQVQALLRDRETLSQQVRQLLTERDHLVALVNAKHQEAILFQEEARKAAESLERDAADNSRLQISYSNLVHDYEQLEIRMTSVQKELSRFKESLNHLEETKEIILTKMDVDHPTTSIKTSVVMENLRSDSLKSSGEKSKEELEGIVEKNTTSLFQKDLLLQENVNKLDLQEKQILQLHHDLREKDMLIHQKMEDVSRLSNDLTQSTNEVGILRKSVENLREQVSNSSREAESLRNQLKNVEWASNEKDAESQAFQETNAQLSVMLKEREYELESLREKVASLTDVLQQHEQGTDNKAQKYLLELDRAKEQTTHAKHERDQIMLTLKQKQLEMQRACEEARQLRGKEVKLQSEIARLQGHLVQVEETYTQEALLSRDREQSLKNRLEAIQNKNASAIEANEHSKQQVESLQEQIRSAAQQRDQAIQNFQLAKEQSAQYSAALHQLQLAAERMQREEAATYSARVDKINQQYQVKVNEVDRLTKESSELKAKLEEAGIALESASRLNEQLEAKEQAIDQLQQLISDKQLRLEEVQDNLHEINAKSANMVDRQLVKNLLIGYFSSPPNKQPDVVRLIASMIGFTKEEEMKLQPSKKGWVSGWIPLPWSRGDNTSAHSHSAPSPSTQQNTSNESFTKMFVQFLENESAAKAPAAKLPAAAMVNEAQQRMTQRKIAAEGIPTPAYNPPRSGNVPERSTVAGRYNPFLVSSTPVSGSSSAGTSSHPLMQPLTPILPTFAPMASAKTASEREILEGILQNDYSS